MAQPENLEINNSLQLQTGAGEALRSEASDLLHAGQPKIAAVGIATGAKPVPLKPGRALDGFEVGRLPGLNTDNFHQQARELMFQQGFMESYLALQPKVDVINLGLPQVHFIDGRNGGLQLKQHDPLDKGMQAHGEKPILQPDRPNPGEEARYHYHTVQRGDNLWKIARENLPSGASNRIVANYVRQIEAYNPMHNPNLIMPGQIIKLRQYDPIAPSRFDHHATPIQHETPAKNQKPYSDHPEPPVLPPYGKDHVSKAKKQTALPASEKDVPANKDQVKPEIKNDAELSHTLEQVRHKIIDAVSDMVPIYARI